MLKRLVTVFLCFTLISSFAQTGEVKGIYPGDTLLMHAVSPQPFSLKIPDSIKTSNRLNSVLNHQETINYKNVADHPWPATFQKLKLEFMKVEIEDPLANLDLHLPSPEELKTLTYSLEGGFGIHLPLISMIYNQFSKEAHSKEIYAELMRKDKISVRYNKAVVSRVTGINDEEELIKFMEFCVLQIQFILESTEYELYAAIMNCYDEFCKTDAGKTAPGK